jgi:type II secretory pathway pseudopilin PulG
MSREKGDKHLVDHRVGLAFQPVKTGTDKNAHPTIWSCYCVTAPCHLFRERRLGAVLAMTLVCLLVVGSLGALLLRSAVQEVRQSRRHQQQLQTLWLVESGLDRALTRLAADAGYAGETWEILAAQLGGHGSAAVHITVEVLEDRPHWRRIDVRAVYPDDPIHRVVQQETIQVELLASGDEP